jgi:hypothetical protein
MTSASLLGHRRKMEPVGDPIPLGIQIAVMRPSRQLDQQWLSESALLKGPDAAPPPPSCARRVDCRHYL